MTDLERQRQSWRMVDPKFEVNPEDLTNDRWPAEVLLEKWERNEIGERRLVAIERYIRATVVRLQEPVA